MLPVPRVKKAAYFGAESKSIGCRRATLAIPSTPSPSMLKVRGSGAFAKCVVSETRDSRPENG